MHNLIVRVLKSMRDHSAKLKWHPPDGVEVTVWTFLRWWWLCMFGISAGTLVNLTEVFHDFHQSLHSNTGIESLVGHCLPNPFYFIIYRPSYDSTLYTLDTHGVWKQKKTRKEITNWGVKFSFRIYFSSAFLRRWNISRYEKKEKEPYICLRTLPTMQRAKRSNARIIIIYGVRVVFWEYTQLLRVLVKQFGSCMPGPCTRELCIYEPYHMKVT
jgi:hypothetical protein